jgi:hypothetical protein
MAIAVVGGLVGIGIALQIHQTKYSSTEDANHRIF